ncbi:MAG TPA: Asp-tRNA(Asn)/Glu-tRNA(Gln) amidotransferase GatCAB subunit B, partial [Polyangiaceae bacterium]|nr:Asp-tRNA(Asn)/Glu-tRNA(Gln) amidotransferase GatCAB subunit B [Polyangiaceae bacterium]
RFVQRAIDSEVARQTALLESGQKVTQETRSFDPDTGLTKTLRSKEEAHDYRYFPEPDLRPLVLDDVFVRKCESSLPELPTAVRNRWLSQGIAAPAAATMSQHPGYVRFFDQLCAVFPNPVKAANFFANDVLRGAKTRGLEATFTVTPEQTAELLALVEKGDISGKQAKEVFSAIENTTRMPSSIVEERGMKVVSDVDSLRRVCQALIEKFPSQAESLRSGKKGVLGFFVGQAMKETGGSANPKLVNELLESLILGGS